jgi:hypothetical protein
MSSAVVALVGVAIGSVATLASQLLNDRLTRRRDVRNQQRERLQGVVTEAALALYTHSRAGEIPSDEFAAIKPGTVAAIEPEVSLRTRPHAEAVTDGITLLQVHFGHDHEIIDEYIKVAEVCLRAETRKIRELHSYDRERIEELASVLHDAQLARDRWTRNARAAVDGI